MKLDESMKIRKVGKMKQILDENEGTHRGGKGTARVTAASPEEAHWG